jgi:hypothetical protein
MDAAFLSPVYPFSFCLHTGFSPDLPSSRSLPPILSLPLVMPPAPIPAGTLPPLPGPLTGKIVGEVEWAPKHAPGRKVSRQTKDNDWHDHGTTKARFGRGRNRLVNEQVWFCTGRWLHDSQAHTMRTCKGGVKQLKSGGRVDPPRRFGGRGIGRRGCGMPQESAISERGMRV